MKPEIPESKFHKQLSMSAIKSYGGVDADLDETPLPQMDKESQSSKRNFDLMLPSMEPTAPSNSKSDEQNKHPSAFVQSDTSPNEFMSSEFYGTNSMSFPSKNDGKLIFKITRYNRSTQKEKIITKNRRIISKCPHTSLKYYAKGMCK